MKKYVNYGALALVVALFASSPASSGTVDFSTLQLNGDAALVNSGSILRLAPALGYTAGTAFITTPFLIDSATTFSTSFTFRIDGGSGADGMTFIVQNDSRGPAALGTSGGDFGYRNFLDPSLSVTPSVAIEFDTWDNGVDGVADPDDNHVGIDLNGSINSVVTASPAFSLEGEPRFAWINYSGGILDIFLSESNSQPATPLLSESLDLAAIVGSQAFFGFGAGTGAATDNHDIEAWSLDGLTPVPAPIPTPATLTILAPGLAGLLTIGWRKRKAA
jgi:hypothetical protein